MEVIRDTHNILQQHQGCVATIGNFDGLHIGHQHIIAQLKQHAERLSASSMVILFEPQAREFFMADKAPPRLMRLRDKLQGLQALGVDRVLCLRFNEHLAKLPAQAFIEALLIKQLAIKHLVIGDDFRFGYQRVGDFALLQQAAQTHGFGLTPSETVDWDNSRISSSRIRPALQIGDFALASALLGRPYCIAGKVAHGDKLGQQWGVPTANLHLHRHATALHGIYTVNVHNLADIPLPGVASLGTRPAVGGQQTILEVHLLQFSQIIYGRRIRVEFLQKLRDEQNFLDINALKQQIFADIAEAKALFVATEQA